MHVATDAGFLDLPPSGAAVSTLALAYALGALSGVMVSLLRPG